MIIRQGSHLQTKNYPIKELLYDIFTYTIQKEEGEVNEDIIEIEEDAKEIRMTYETGYFQYSTNRDIPPEYQVLTEYILTYDKQKDHYIINKINYWR